MPSARRIQWAKFRIGATVFCALLILGVLTALLLGGSVFEPKDTLRVYVPDATGLDRLTPVTLNGIPIGKVREIRLSHFRDPNRVVEVTFRIAHRYLRQIPVDSTATLTSLDIQGDKFLDVTRGHSATSLRPGGELRFQPAPDVLKTLDLAQFEVRLRAIDALLADIQSGKGSLGALVRKDAAYKSVAANLAGLQKALRSATSTQEALGRFLYRDDLYQEIVAPVEKLDQALARIQRGEGDAGRLFASSAPYDRLRNNVGEFRRQLAAIQAGEGPAGGFLQRDDLWVAWNRRVGSMIAALESVEAGEGAAGRLLMGTYPYESLEGLVREMGAFVHDFRDDPRKFLRLVVF